MHVCVPICVCARICLLTAGQQLKRKARRSSYPFLRQADSWVKEACGSEWPAGCPSIADREGRITHPEKKHAQRGSRERGRKEQRQREIKTGRERPKSYRQWISARDKASGRGVCV